ncbi:hypothetical protein GR254_24585, partial [Mycobacterium tuberculosis]|nr:hypothetical protein [Mycobacterium tuberculosis]
SVQVTREQMSVTISGLRRDYRWAEADRHLWIAAERGFIDAVIDPHETRLLLRKSMHLLRDKQLWWRVGRKHGLIPV